MRQRIEQELDRLAECESISILYACESGSRAWDFASTDSDYDVRFIYARALPDYVRLDVRRDVIEEPITDALDVNGWDMFKACGLLRKSNPPLMEWLGSPIVYRQQAEFAEPLRREAESHFSLRSCGEHYMSMAKRNFRGYIDGRDTISRKKYLYALRPIACARYLLAHGRFPPTRYAQTLAGIELPAQVQQCNDALLTAKAAGEELAKGPPIDVLSEYLRASLDELPESISALPHRRFPADALNQIIRNVLGIDQ